MSDQTNNTQQADIAVKESDTASQEELKEEVKNEEEKDAAESKSKKKLADDRDRVASGMLVRVYEKIHDVTPKGEARERTQIFKGIVLGRKHGCEIGATITVHKQSGGVQVEKIFPVYSPIIERIVIDKVFKTRRSKLYFLRDYKKRLKEVVN